MGHLHFLLLCMPWISRGSGPIACSFQISGRVNSQPERLQHDYHLGDITRTLTCEECSGEVCEFIEPHSGVSRWRWFAASTQDLLKWVCSLRVSFPCSKSLLIASRIVNLSLLVNEIIYFDTFAVRSGKNITPTLREANQIKIFRNMKIFFQEWKIFKIWEL